MADSFPFLRVPLITLERHVEGCQVAVWTPPRGIWLRSNSEVCSTSDRATELANAWSQTTGGAITFDPYWRTAP